ncbi:hypothetical protein HNP48_000688 [Acidovorax soli]|uniref:Type IV pilin accessory protein n=1 Tax=Acidovorax soli TaxID=592050 RepID=A0A7X0PA47_9BURK|nr:hypothetical protein [Acidovorax soli]MBB6558024.1 hypothetical protein [Acidovorax soli]
MNSQVKKRLLVPLRHFLVSLLVALAVAGLVFFVWFPGQIKDLAGGQKLFWTLVGVDVVCGPLLTLILYRPEKTRLALGIDLGLIAAIQLCALGYGLHTLAQARPLAFVFEVDRFRAVSYVDIQENDLIHVPDWFMPWSLNEARTVGLRPVSSSAERFDNINDSMQGIEAGQRPKRWQDYQLSIQQVFARAQPLTALYKKYPQRQQMIGDAVGAALNNAKAGDTNDGNSLVWLPLVSRHSLDWIVLLDPKSARIRAYIPLDGF